MPSEGWRTAGTWFRLVISRVMVPDQPASRTVVWTRIPLRARVLLLSTSAVMSWGRLMVSMVLPRANDLGGRSRVPSRRVLKRS
jgi:hypothetical protein